MPILNKTHTCLLIDDEDLVVSFVRTSPTSVATMRGPRLERYLTLQSPDRSLRADRSSPITLVIPGAWCASRPMPLSITRWARSRPEIAASVDSLFPFSPDDALLEYISCAHSTSSADHKEKEADEGVLVAISRTHLAPWIDAIERDFGRTPDRIVSTHATLPGLGFQGINSAVVLEPDAVGSVMAHSLACGVVRSIDDPAPSSDSPTADPVFLFPGIDQNSPHEGKVLDAHTIAAGAAIAEHIAPGSVSPFIGKRSSPLRRMALPAAIAVAALIILVTASSTSQSRLRSGLEKLRTEQAALQPQIDEIQSIRASTSRLANNTERIRALTADPGVPMLSLLAAGHAMLPEDGYMYRARFTPASVEIRGQCQDVGGLLREIETSGTFTDARRLSPSTQIDGGGSTFDIAASVSKPLPGAVR